MTWLDPSPLIAQALEGISGTVREHRIWPEKQKAKPRVRDNAKDKARWKLYYWRNRTKLLAMRKSDASRRKNGR